MIQTQLLLQRDFLILFINIQQHHTKSYNNIQNHTTPPPHPHLLSFLSIKQDKLPDVIVQIPRSVVVIVVVIVIRLDCGNPLFPEIVNKQLLKVSTFFGILPTHREICFKIGMWGRNGAHYKTISII
jgi:hypothetical protein